jgi:WD40 repeat protein
MVKSYSPGRVAPRAPAGKQIPPLRKATADSHTRGSVWTAASLWLAISALLLGRASLHAQVETVQSPSQAPTWISHGRVEGHLALRYSPSGAFSPDSTVLAVPSQDRVVLMDLSAASVRKLVHPHMQGVTGLDVQAANFIAPNRVFLLANGLIAAQGKSTGGPTPLLAFEWDTDRDGLFGKINTIGAGGGFGAARYFPEVGYIGLYKQSTFQFWNPSNGRGSKIEIPDLNRQPNVYAISPDGHWLLAAQIEASSTADPVVVDMSTHHLVDSLRGHQGTVLSIAFSLDGKRVSTACEDGKIRVWSAPDWKLLVTLTGHQGAVHWAEFSPDGQWLASAGEDKSARIWSVGEGKLVQTLEESLLPLLTVAFSPNGEYVAASAEQTVLVWQRKNQ